MTHNSLPPGSIVLAAEQGRTYDMGFMRAVFKADGAETDDRYSVSEWWMEPHNTGPGAHHHEDNDEAFYVLEGTASILIGHEWVDLGKVPSSAFRLASRTTSKTAPTHPWGF